MLMTPTFLMFENAEVKPFLGTTPSGPKYGETFRTKCRFERRRKRMLDAAGKYFYSEGIVFLPASNDIINLELESVIILTEGSYKIIDKKILKEFKVNHIECVVM